MLLGNDIVDLRDPETVEGGQHPRFDARVFSESERATVARSADPHATRWGLWACKESAYKACKRLDDSGTFSPVAFQVRWSAPCPVGTVRWRNRELPVRIELTDDYVHVHVIAVGTGVEGRTGVAHRTAGTNASDRVRALAASMLRELVPDRVGFARHGGIPCAYRAGARLPVELSFSHHGRFVAVALAYLGIAQVPQGRPSSG